MTKTDKLLKDMVQFEVCLSLVQYLLLEYQPVDDATKLNIIRRFDETKTYDEAKALFEVICDELAW